MVNLKKNISKITKKKNCKLIFSLSIVSPFLYPFEYIYIYINMVYKRVFSLYVQMYFSFLSYIYLFFH